jgi:hypothetical protein
LASNKLTLQSILQQGYQVYERHHPLPGYVRRAVQAILACRTAILSGHVQACPEGHLEWIWDNSCRHRMCPPCGWLQVIRWLLSQQARLLACAHDHVIFTIPSELHDLWLGNVAVMTTLLFASVRDTVLELLSDEQYLGVTPGIIATLHPWSQTLVLHPHIHALVTGEGLTNTGRWVPVRNGFLLPLRPHHSGTGDRHVQQIASDALHDGPRHQPAELAVSGLPVHPVPEGDLLVPRRHQPVVGEGPNLPIPCERGEHPGPVGIALREGHGPLGTAQLVQQVGTRLRTHSSRQLPLPLAQRSTDGIKQLAEAARHDDPRRKQKPVSQRHPSASARQAPAVMRPWICGCRISVWLHGCKVAMMPVVAPKYSGLPSSSSTVSRTLANRSVLITAMLASHRALRAHGAE